MEVNEEESSLVFLKRGRGTVLLYAGHQYYKNKTYANGQQIWKCASSKSNKCVGSVTLQENNIRKSKMHSNNCSPNFAKNDIDLKIHQCKEKVAKQPEESIPTIYKQTLVDIKDSGVDLICEIPSFTSVKSTLYNKRNNAVGMQRTCFKNVGDVIVPPRDQSFLLGDYCCDNVRILVFCTDETRQLLKNVKHVLGDGTFRACPEPFMQIYTLHGDIGSSSTNTNIIPMIYALMSERTQKAYVALFEMIKSQIPDWSPTKFTSDFEQPSSNAMLAVFPEITTKGCYYHFRNSIWRKCKSRIKELDGLLHCVQFYPYFQGIK